MPVAEQVLNFPDVHTRVEQECCRTHKSAEISTVKNEEKLTRSQVPRLIEISISRSPGLRHSACGDEEHAPRRDERVIDWAQSCVSQTGVTAYLTPLSLNPLWLRSQAVLQEGARWDRP